MGKFRKNPTSGLGGDAITKKMFYGRMDGRTYAPTFRVMGLFQWEFYIGFYRFMC